MRQVIIVALVCLNASLLVALVFGTGTPAAEAQVIGGGTNYIMLTGDIREDYDAIYIMDLGKRQLAALKFDKKGGLKGGRLVMVGPPRVLPRDFGKVRKDQ
jgi:hypothetical protein